MASSSLAFTRLWASFTFESEYARCSLSSNSFHVDSIYHDHFCSPWCPQRREWISGAASSLYHLSCWAKLPQKHSASPQQWRPRALEPSQWWETYRSCSRVVLKKWPRHDVTSGLSPASALHPFPGASWHQTSSTHRIWATQQHNYLMAISMKGNICISYHFCILYYIFVFFLISSNISNGCTMITMVHLTNPYQSNHRPHAKARQHG